MSAYDVQVGGNHYKKLKIQPMEYAMANELSYAQANAVKYVSRYKLKYPDSIEEQIKDLNKAKQNIDFLLEELEKEKDGPEFKVEDTFNVTNRFFYPPTLTYGRYFPTSNIKDALADDEGEQRMAPIGQNGNDGDHYEQEGK